MPSPPHEETSPAVPDGAPADHSGGPEPVGDPGLQLGVFTMYVVVFLTLLARGTSPRDALCITGALGVGGAELLRRLRNTGPGDPGGPGAGDGPGCATPAPAPGGAP